MALAGDNRTPHNPIGHILNGDETLCGAPNSQPLLSEDAVFCGACLDIAHGNTDDVPFGDDGPLAYLERWLTTRYASMPYDIYLQTAHWQTLRRLAIEHYGSTCVICNRTPVQVHHRTYERRGRERLDDLIVLCDSCHASYHGKAA